MVVQEVGQVQHHNWLNNIDRNVIPYIKEPDWKYSYPAVTALNITQEEKDNLFDVSSTLFWAMQKTVKSIRHIPMYKSFNFIASKFDCVSNLSRMDFVKDKQGNFKFVEINADTPCAIPETFYGNFRYNGAEENDDEKKLNHKLYKLFYDLCPNNSTLVFACDFDYEEDLSNARYLYNAFVKYQILNEDDRKNINPLLLPLSELEVFDDGVYVKNTTNKIDVLYRLYPTEMLIQDKSEEGFSVGQKLIELHNENKVIMINPPEAIIMQDKRLPAIMDYLQDKHCFYSKKEVECLSNYVPLSTLDEHAVTWNPVIKKSIYGREGLGILIIKYGKVIEGQPDTSCFDKYIYEEYIEQNKIDIETNEGDTLNGYVTYSVFLLNGEPVGLYARFDTNRICGVDALWLPVVVGNNAVEKDTALNFK